MSERGETEPEPPTTYAAAGVDIAAGNRFVELIKPLVERTRRPELLSGVGGFGALLEIPQGYRQPVLVSSTDGVGTKLKLGFELGIHDTVGIDLVAMCVNDILTCGAEPLFFLDYFASGALQLEVATAVVAGIVAGCEQAGAVLAGGETAEMPGMYGNGEYDLAGFSVGIVEKARIIDGRTLAVEDALIGIASSGFHANGYSLIRKILRDSGESLQRDFAGRRLGDLLLAPTKIYVKTVQRLLPEVNIKAMAHITGGGLVENVPRVLPPGCGATIRGAAWPRPLVYDWLGQSARIAPQELYRTFNCGIGMVLAVDPEQQDRTLELLNQDAETAWPIGTVMAADRPRVVIL